MGNTIDKRAGFEGGFIFVKSEKPSYYPGDTVKGKIFLRLMTPMSASNLEIRVKGKEQSVFLIYVSHGQYGGHM